MIHNNELVSSQVYTMYDMAYDGVYQPPLVLHIISG